MTKVRFDAPTEAPQRRGFRPKAPAAAVALPRLQPGHPWLYAHRPSRWAVMGEELVPDLIKVSGQPGVGGTGREDGTGGGSMHAAVSAMERSGATVIVDTTLGGALDGECYVSDVPTRGGVAWLDYAADPIANSAQVRVDEDKRLRVLRAIRDMVPPPEDYVITAAIDRAERDYADAYKDADRNPIKQRQADRIAGELAVWRAALEQGTPTPDLSPTPKPKTRRRAKPAAAEE